MSDSLEPQALQPTRFLCPWDSPGENAGVGTNSFLQVNISQNTNNLQNTTNLDSNDKWALALKVLAWVVFVVCVVASIILFGEYQADIAWIPLVYGVLQLVPTMVIANISANLKKSNQIQNAILGELKKQNK